MTSAAKRLARIILGFTLLAVGVIGGLIPIFQGWIFGLAGLMLLAPEFSWARRILDWLKQKKAHLFRGSPDNAAGRAPNEKTSAAKAEE